MATCEHLSKLTCAGGHWMAEIPEKDAYLTHGRLNDQDKDKEVRVDSARLPGNTTTVGHILKGQRESDACIMSWKICSCDAYLR